MIIDFGIAKSAKDEKTLLGDDFAGKLSYASPEQLGLAGKQITDKTDVYALGLVFAEALTADSMKMSGSQAEAVEKRKSPPGISHVPAPYRRLIAAMLDPEPARRPTMEQVVAWEIGRETDDDDGGGGILRTIVLGGAAVATTAVILVGLYFLLVPATVLEPPAEGRIAAREGKVGETYDWTMPDFAYNGDVADLRMRTDDPLPPGLALIPRDRTVTITGTPTAPADTTVEIEATGADDTRATQSVSIVIVAPPNEPPAVADSRAGALQLTAGESVNVRLGSFADDKGPGQISIAATGQVPRGMAIDVPEPGTASLAGTPEGVGSFAFEVVATDGDGASASFPVSGSVSDPVIDPASPLSRLLGLANGTPCFFVRERDIPGDQVGLEAFGQSTDPMAKLDNDFKREFNAEADILGWLVTSFQCRYVDMFAAADPNMFASDAAISVPATARSGSVIRGTVRDGADALLYLVDEGGRTSELRADGRIVGQDLEFDVRLTGRGAQLIVAAVPVTPGALAGARTLQDLLRPSMRGRVRLSVGYVLLE